MPFEAFGEFFLSYLLLCIYVYIYENKDVSAYKRAVTMKCEWLKNITRSLMLNHF